MDGTRLAWMPVLAVLLLLQGCGIPKLRHGDTAHELPATFNGEIDGENSSQLSIDEFFGDVILTGMIHQGLRDNQNLKILGEEIQIANNEILRRRGAIFPFVSLGLGAGLAKPSFFTPGGAVEEQLQFQPGQNFPTPLPDFMGAANFQWQVDIWRQLRNARDAAGLRYLGTYEGRNYVVTRLVAEIADNYYGLLALDRRIENLDRTIQLQEQSLEFAKSMKAAGRGTELGIQRFLAEIRRNQSEKLIYKQDIIETENKINFLIGRFPEPVQRSTEFFDLSLHALNLGVPSELLLNRPDIRKAERELQATGLDVKIARAEFYPKLNITGGVGYEAFNLKYIAATPESLIYNVVGDLAVPLINKAAIKAEYMNANAKQLQALYDYQRTVLEAFTEVINRVSMVRNYTESIEIKKQQLAALEESVAVASNLFQNARAEYIDVLFAQRDLRDARMVLIDTKRQQLSAIVNTYQALGGGLIEFSYPTGGMIEVDQELPSPSSPEEQTIPEGPTPTVVPPQTETPKEKTD